MVRRIQRFKLMDCEIAWRHGAGLGRVGWRLFLLELEANGADMAVAHGKHVKVLPLVPVVQVLVGAWGRLNGNEDGIGGRTF